MNLKEPDFRMRDAEILLRYLAYQNFAPEYAGNLKLFLDETTRKFNETWEENSELLSQQVSEMENAFTFMEEVFGSDKYLRKWNGTEFEPRKNRAVFDIMLHFFSDPALRQRLEGKADQIVENFKNLCSHNADFLASIERTTKTNEANHIRFNLWAEALSEIAKEKIAPINFGQ